MRAYKCTLKEINMKAELYFFTGTGNSYYIAKKISESISHSTLIPINTLDLSKEIKSNGQIVGIIFPVYFYNAPEIVTDFIKKLVVSPSSYVFLYENFGLQGGNALSNAARILEERNIKVSNTFSVTLPDNSIIFPTPYNKIQPMLDTAESKIQGTIYDIQSLKLGSVPKKKPMLNFLSSIMLRFSKSYLGFTDFKIDHTKCFGCGLCGQVCPMNNIELKNRVPFFEDKCQMCFACIHYCPNEAIRFKRMKPKNNYQCTNPYIPIQDIIEKNKTNSTFF